MIIRRKNKKTHLTREENDITLTRSIYFSKFYEKEGIGKCHKRLKNNNGKKTNDNCIEESSVLNGRVLFY